MTVNVFALGVAWSEWKTLDGSVLALVGVAVATLVCAVAALVAGRVLVVLTRGGRSAR